MDNQQPQVNGMTPEKQQPQVGQQPVAAYEQAGKLSNNFQFGLFDCFAPITTCCLGTWCPCILYGRITARERGERDPSGINGMCAAHCALLYCGVSPILQFINRMNMKEKYGIEANPVMDCLTAFCCGCCELIQEDKETIVRQTGINPTTQQQYQAPQGMNYA